MSFLGKTSFWKMCCSKFSNWTPQMTPSGASLGIAPSPSLLDIPLFALYDPGFSALWAKVLRLATAYNRIRLQHHNTIANRREVCCSRVEYCLHTVVNFHLKKVLEEENRNHEIAIIFAYLVSAAILPSFL